MTMTTGELDYEGIFRLDSGGGSDDVTEIPFREISIILWILFLIMMPILLSNLLVSIKNIIYINFEFLGGIDYYIVIDWSSNR